MNRKHRRALGHSGAGTATAGPIADMLQTAVALHRAGQLAEAERRYREVLDRAPAQAEAHSRLGGLLMAQGRIQEAIAHLERALSHKPDLYEAWGNLAQARIAAGEMELAVQALSRALEINETPQGKTLFAHAVKAARLSADKNGRIRKLMLRALTEGWAPPRELTAAGLNLVRLNKPLLGCIERADTAWPRRLPAPELFGAAGVAALADDQLLQKLLECDPLPDLAIERLMTNVRAAMLALASAQPAKPGERELGCYSAVARQCFINEYVYALPDAEAAEARALQSALAARLADDEPIPPLWPITVAAYFPLDELAGAERLGERPWPACVAGLIEQQIGEPARERAIAATLPVLTALDDAVTDQVRRQYEESPYPRWVNAGPPAAAAATAAPRLDVLIAGCGTGLSTVEFARQAPAARILAVDISRASLSYAKRMAEKFALANVEFAQADIMKLAAIGRDFDLIDASGVLHHLADPWAGWRALLALLRPGGTMQVGLYSDLARRNVVAARALIAARGYRPIPADIRRCREEIIAAEDPLLKSLLRSGDFFTTSECRDLMFHVQEHRVALPEIAAFLGAHHLSFAGFILDNASLRRFAARFPEPGALTDLNRWHVFETEAPNTFAAMYQFQVRKPAGPTAAEPLPAP